MVSFATSTTACLQVSVVLQGPVFSKSSVLQGRVDQFYHFPYNYTNIPPDISRLLEEQELQERGRILLEDIIQLCHKPSDPASIATSASANESSVQQPDSFQETTCQSYKFTQPSPEKLESTNGDALSPELQDSTKRLEQEQYPNICEGTSNCTLTGHMVFMFEQFQCLLRTNSACSRRHH